MKLRFTPRAAQDLVEIADFIQEQSPNAALRVRESILASLQHVALFPHVGRPQRVPGVRKLVTRRYRYLVYYTIDEAVGEVIVLTLRHPARDRTYPDA